MAAAPVSRGRKRPAAPAYENARTDDRKRPAISKYVPPETANYITKLNPELGGAAYRKETTGQRLAAVIFQDYIRAGSFRAFPEDASIDFDGKLLHISTLLTFTLNIDRFGILLNWLVFLSIYSSPIQFIISSIVLCLLQ